ncbi:MAG: endolytic transglycosylase MltG [Gammaproteobacteria bacterium]|nr:endolytic transglycosylase MltG [Gammaproteobacteria bacterium]
MLLFVLSALAVGAAGYWAATRYFVFADVPIAGLDAGDSIVIEPGDSFVTVLGKLHAAGVPDGQELEWQALARQLGAANRLQAGEYALAPGTTPRMLLTRMREGRVISHRFTIVEGWTIRQLRAALARARPLRQETAQLDDAALMKTLGHPGQHPEGRFLPETYLYTRGGSDLDLLTRAHKAMTKALDAAWQARASDLPLKSKEEALILASIVERETGIAAERPQIAGLFVRRLKLGMRLQTDPTVIYGMGTGYAGNIRKIDLLTDTPYNTYTRTGLPPTPIAMPGVDALRAATQPAAGDTQKAAGTNRRLPKPSCC